MTDFYLISNRFVLACEYPKDDSVIRLFRKEYADFLYEQNFSDIPLIGKIRCSNKKLELNKRKELVKDTVYEIEDALMMKSNDKFALVKGGMTGFNIEYQKGFNSHFLFYITECLIRLYSYQFGIDFFHASAFRYKEEVYMINGFGGSGKTEIMLNALLKNASFIADDLVIVNQNNEIFPYRVSIPLRWHAITPEIALKLGYSNQYYKICRYCQKKNGKITRRIFGKLASRFSDDISYTQFTSSETQIKFHKVDKCFWIQEANFSGNFKINGLQFYDYMNLCLINESRKYFDLEGFFFLKFPDLKKLIPEREQLRKTICQNFHPKGFAVFNRDFIESTNQLLKS